MKNDTGSHAPGQSAQGCKATIMSGAPTPAPEELAKALEDLEQGLTELFQDMRELRARVTRLEQDI